MLRRFGTLRYQIALILALVILPLAALALYLELDDERRDVAEAQEDAEATVRLVTQNLSRVIESARDLVIGLSSNFITPDHPDACSAQLASLRPAFPQFANMVLIDKDRHVICAASNPTGMSQIPADSDMVSAMARARQTKQPEMGTFVKTAQDRLVIPLVGPVIDRSGQVPYFFFVTFDLRWMNEQVNRIAIPKESILLVMDRRGTIMARNPRSDTYRPGVAAPDFERTLPGHPAFSGEIESEGGINHVYSVAKAGSGEGLTVVMTERSSDIYKPARRRLWLHLVGLAGVGLFALALAWLGSDRYFTGPLSRLIHAADRLAAGDRSARSGLDYGGDIGSLAHSFDLMANALEQEQVRTQKTARTFRSIIEGTSTSAGEAFFRSLVTSMTSALEADLALVGELSPDLQAVTTLAMCVDGIITHDAVLPLKGGPCEDVAHLVPCYYNSGIQDCFPNDPIVQRYGMQSCLAAPLVNEDGKAIGLIAVAHRQAMSNDVADPLSMLKVFAARASVELTRLRVERELRESLTERKIAADLNLEMVRTLRALTARIESVREEERSHIAREIHDELGQQLTAMRFSLKSLKNQLAQNSTDRDSVASLPGRFSELTSLVDSMIGEVRRIATELRPQVLDSFGMIAAIEWLAQDFQMRTGIDCRYDGPKDLAVSSELATAVFRICQESLTNIARHACATAARIRLGGDDGWLSLSISDNGQGISPEQLATTRSLGVVGMRERARMAGGEFLIGTAPGGGTTVNVRLPLATARVEGAEAARVTVGARTV